MRSVSETLGSWEPYLAAWGKVLALGVDALVVVDVVLPAVLGLVHVRESSIDTCGSAGQSGCAQSEFINNRNGVFSLVSQFRRIVGYSFNRSRRMMISYQLRNHN